MKKYEELIEQIRSQIQNEVWQPGEKLPSLRKQAERCGVSLMTVVHAYQVLESQGWVISRARSGYVVAPKVENSDSVPANQPVEKTESVDINDFVFEVLQASRTPSIIDFGKVHPDPTLYPRQHVNKSLISTARTLPSSSAMDNLPPGNLELRQHIAKRYAAQGMTVHPDEIVITTGALEALNLSLQSVTQPGDWVVVESPTFYGALQSLQRLNLRALSIRTHPADGIDLESLENALQSHPVKACWLMTNHQNPLGFTLSASKKQRLMTLLAKYDVYLIEDDVYNELYFGSDKPLPAKAFDSHGKTLHCSSFSKSLVAGFRIGWVAAGKMAVPIQKLQMMSTLSTSAPIQMTLASYLSTRNYERHLRQMRRTLEQRKFATWQALRNHLPAQVNINCTEGGYFLWLELPVGFDATELYRRALEYNICITPGKMFSAGDFHNHCFRLNVSFELTHSRLNAIKTLGELIRNQLSKPLGTKQ
ncbi:PLP-dependent aminotransferase family protein [Ferrimonas aestuarii]|uniref:PLP-dependent aminotransferase family protein n=1 Tax=Ferrimonas aestuarii TaxID=2569539 RepID=A0A4U1BL36_9GAMM|nr:PLP-dependent aminotransferase family protein [Ferrimonas aestuarii]TKB53375.1 PLP-dependent aminotransferase family protein [Ferrimonas aestuarii]